MRILLVEDDQDQLEPLTAALKQAGHIVDAAENGETAQWLLGEKTYDLLVLDWMLPDVEGVQLCQHYRQSGHGSPVLLLTAKDTVQDRVTGLDAGADDYLIKPVDLMELLARVRALGRRSPLWTGDVLTVADLTLNLSNLIVERPGCDSLQLSSREFQLLECFMRHPQQVMTRDQLEQALWEWGAEPESNAIATMIRRLRLRLQRLQCDHWIETVYGTGYRLVPKTDA
ncbi:two-component system response regulator RppA [Vacuolonema iberomarrocanum]|uniref:two-component system response regulator RppA n=1 Tax=Vacuolonema iberomarrocanum TaxID=3454632 RepID=UPI0019FB08F8|nr:response regulator transcription factor [filamentous cyanobacterium LEGE 07170]